MSLNMTTRFQPPEGEKNMKLNKIIGHTSLSNNYISISENGYICYSAGCVAILYNLQTNRQDLYFTVNKAISSLILSSNGLYLAIGERGHQPSITIWNTETLEKLITLNNHQHGIGALKFSLDSKYLVSIGFKNDKQLILWDWIEGKQISIMKLENKVNSIDFHMSGQFFVTCGDLHLKWWYLLKENDTINNKQFIKGLNGRPASILDLHRNSHFIDIVCPKLYHTDQSISSNVYALTITGVLCLLHESRLMDKWVQIDTPTAYSLTLTQNSYLLVGGTNGRIFIYSAVTLEYLTLMPFPFPLSTPSSLTSNNINKNNENNNSQNLSIKYPACYTLSSVPNSSYILSTYADRSMFIWDLNNIHQPIKFRSFVSHSSCIWDVLFIQDNLKNDNSNESLPFGTFITCGADNMIYFWNIDPKQQRLSSWKSTSCRELLHSINISIDDQNISTFERNLRQSQTVDPDLSCNIPDLELPDRQQGSRTARCLALHPNGNELACGDKLGTVHIYNLNTMKSPSNILHGIKAHDAEILTLCYSPIISHISNENISENYVFLASGGRDRLIHIYDASDNDNNNDYEDGDNYDNNDNDNKRYNLVTTLDSHSSSVTVSHFTSDGKKFISCSGDKTMVINSINGHDFQRLKSIPTPHGTINGFALDSATTKFAVSTGQDKRINVWNLQTGKLMRSYRPEGLNSEFYKCCVDPSGMFVATCSFDKQIRIYDFFSGELIHQDFGHSDLITSLKFSPDGKNLISVGGDGCIMIWQIAEHLVEIMEDRLVELYAIAERKKNLIDEKAKQVQEEPKNIVKDNELISNKSNTNVRTGGGSILTNKKVPSKNEQDNLNDGIIGKGISNSSKRPSTSSNLSNSSNSSIEKNSQSSITRPATSSSPRSSSIKSDQNKSKSSQPSARRLPSWAAKGLNSGNNSNSDEISLSTPIISGGLNNQAQNKWANRAINQDIQILGKPLINKDKHKLTLELTANESTWNPNQIPLSTSSKTTDRLASTLEEFDDVLLMEDPNNLNDELDTSDEEFTSNVDNIDEDENEDEDRLNMTSNKLDELEESAEKLESWLEKKLREETQIDPVTLEDISFTEVDSSSSKSLLGSSLSSDFFKKAKDNMPLPPPPSHPTSSSSSVITSSSPNISSREHLYLKQQETAVAVTQMRDRLKAMGILNKTKELDQNNSNLEIPQFLPPPPPPYTPISEESDNNKIQRKININKTKQQFNNNNNNNNQDIVNNNINNNINNNNNKEKEDDDTASTVSGGSDILLENNDDDNKDDNNIIVDENELIEAEKSYRLLLSDFNSISMKALDAYQTLLEKKRNVIQNQQLSSIESKTIPIIKEDSSIDQISPSFSAVSPRGNRNFGTQKKNSNNNVHTIQSTPALDELLHDFETNFDNIITTAEKILTSSGIQSFHNSVGYLQTSISNTKSTSLIGANQSIVNNNDHNKNNSNNHHISLDSSFQQSTDNINLSQTTKNEPSNEEVSYILEKYSDKLLTLVTEKMLASQQNK